MLRRKLKPSTTVFGRRLRDARLAAQFTQEKLGVAIGIDEGNAAIRVSRYESGVHAPAVEQLGDIARVLSVPPGYLVTDEDPWADMILRLNALNAEQWREVVALVDRLTEGRDDGSAS